MPLADEVASGTPPPTAPGDAAAADGAPQARGVLWWVTLAIITVDQMTKALVRAQLPLFESANIIPGLLDFTHVRNTGVAFGLMNDSDVPFKTGVTVAMAGIALTGIALYARHLREHERIARIGLSMILGGAAGNLFDRLRLGYVVDFVDVYWKAWHFWAFNVADAAITIGAVLVFLDLLLVNRHASRSV